MLVLQKKNKGNQSCELYPYITEELWDKCTQYEVMTCDEVKKKVEDGIKLYFDGIEDPDTE
ncbi:MAG: hypothetical protein J6T84_12345 [Spirochaetaceae bacterium]|nr:hypothetical protein [Spirochaetaceae bacterium]